MAEESFGVRPREVVRHAASVDEIATQVDGARRAAVAVSLRHDAYGVLCASLPLLFEPAQNTTADAFRDAVDALQRTADDLRAAAAGYHDADRSTAELIPDG